jgi:hypothetical protein
MRRSPKFIAASLGLALLSLGAAGCKTHTTVAKLDNGYEEVSHPFHTLIEEPEPPRLALQYRSTNDTVTPIWPALDSTREIIHGDLAIFIAEKAYLKPAPETRPRIFAVRAPALPLDITDESLWRWAKANGRKIGKTMEKLSTFSVEEKNDGIEVSLVFYSNTEMGGEREDWPDEGTLQLTWRQIDEIMHVVTIKGVQQKDVRWHTPYIGETF